MRITFEVFGAGKAPSDAGTLHSLGIANNEVASSLEEAAQVYNRLRRAGYAVIPRDEQGQEYWMDESEGTLKPKR